MQECKFYLTRISSKMTESYIKIRFRQNNLLTNILSNYYVLKEYIILVLNSNTVKIAAENITAPLLSITATNQKKPF